MQVALAVPANTDNIAALIKNSIIYYKPSVKLKTIKKNASS